MEKLSAEDMALIDDLFKTVFRDIINNVQKIKAEHPEEWAEYEKNVSRVLYHDAAQH